MYRFKRWLAKWLGLDTVIIVRLDPTMLADLEKNLPRPGAGVNDTPATLGFTLGVAHTLRLLRDGYTTKGNR